MEKKREEGESWFSEIIRKDREIQRMERWKRILDSKFSKWYKEVKGEGVLEYLKKGWGRAGGGQ